MLENAFFLILGLILLVKGADLFVERASRIARRLAVDDLMIGLTITAVGTSLPELASSISASLQHSSGLIVGNILGSNIANIGLILGVVACMRTIKTIKRTYFRDGYFMILSVLIFAAFASDGTIARYEAVALLILYVLYALFLIHTRERVRKIRFHDFLDYLFHMEYLYTIRSPSVRSSLHDGKSVREKRAGRAFREGMLLDGLLMAAGLAALVLGARWLVAQSILVAALAGVPENVIGLSLIAVGTSVPELAVSISALRKKYSNIVMGNVVGSNIANLLLVGGVASTLNPVQVSTMSLTYTIPIMAFFTVFLLYVMQQKRLTRVHGVLLLIAYILFMACAFAIGLA